MNEHPDFLTMAQIVNGNDDLSDTESAAAITAYIAKTIGVPVSELAGAAQDEAFMVMNAASKNGIDVVARTAWTVGFFFGVRMARGITTDQIQRGDDPYLGIDRDSVNEMAFGRTRLMLAAPLYRADFRRTEHTDHTPTVSSGEGHIAEAAWLDGAMTGIHFDKARIA